MTATAGPIAVAPTAEIRSHFPAHGLHRDAKSLSYIDVPGGTLKPRRRLGFAREGLVRTG
jgi:hypothetical protein